MRHLVGIENDVINYEVPDPAVEVCEPAAPICEVPDPVVEVREPAALIFEVPDPVVEEIHNLSIIHDPLKSASAPTCLPSYTTLNSSLSMKHPPGFGPISRPVIELNGDKSTIQQAFVKQVERCGEMQRKLRSFSDQIDKAGVLCSPSSSLQPDIELVDLEVQLSEHEAELRELISNSEKLQRTYNELLEFKFVLLKASGFLASGTQYHDSLTDRELEEIMHGNEQDVENLALPEQEIQEVPKREVGLKFVSGIICTSSELKFERMLFRATRGNMFFNHAPANGTVVDPLSGDIVEKTVFVVFFYGERIREKILKICEAFGVNCYPVPEDSHERKQITQEVSSHLTELEATLDAGIRHRNQVLSSIGNQLSWWTIMVKKEKAVYDTLNMLNFDVMKKCLVGEGWYPTAAKSQIEDVLIRAAFDSRSQLGILNEMDATESPPTYFRTNKFTNAFQEIVDAYGIARYQEANPAVFSIITFPFLFAVMFGDWGHGICLLLGALFFILKEKKFGSQKLGSFVEMAFGGRYTILLMALFSIYCGLIYNEFFSVPFHIFGPSAYKCRDSSCRDAHTIGLIKYRDPYKFGVDPSWRGSRSELPFLNSLKMKMSILLGITQMNLGIITSYFNAKFFGNHIDIWFQFIPQMIFLNGLFGYLALLIITKWATGSQADLYHVMIYMFLSPTDDLKDNQLFPGQKYLQMVLLVLSLVAMPWMLLPKPFILKRRHAESSRRPFSDITSTSEMDHGIEPDSTSLQQQHNDFNFGEVFVHQMIHSIEFVLGAVSNTASYLRLWALSLAHSELSTVFYEKILLLSWKYNIAIRIAGIIIFAFATISILLMMETLSAFLHALRLHWVEFMNKFYHGDGYKFTPFSFASQEDEEE